jgi:hypothetical protein
MTAPRWPRLPLAAALVAYFCYFCWDSVRVKFAPDDLMNLEHYWRLSSLQLAGQFLAPWTGGYRPMGALYYLPLLRGFGLDPAPFHVALLAILLANVFLLYRLARTLGCPETAAAVAAMLACYHPGLSFLYFNTSFIYDALCCFFYLAALGYYTGVRSTGRALAPRQMAVFLALQFCALHSKEMAVTLPAVVLAYEVFCQKRRQFAGAVLAGALNLPFLYGLFLGANSMTQLPIYRPELSAARVFAFHRDSFADLFVSWHFFTPGWVLAVWALLTVLAWWRRRPVLRFCWCFFVLAPVPLELLEGRTVACLAIPFCALAIFAGALLADLAESVGRLSRRPAAQRAIVAAVLAVTVVPWAVHSARVKRRLIRPQMRELGQETWNVIRQFRDLNPKVQPNDTILFLDDPFDGFDMAFIAELWFRQPGLNIRLNRKTPFTPDELTKVDHLFTYKEGRLIQIR